MKALRRQTCANNIHQVALAANQYETSNRQYPFNWGQVSTVGTPTQPSPGSNGSTSVGVSWLAALLPYFDQRPLFNQVALGKDPTLAPGAAGYGVLEPLNCQNTANGVNNLTALETPINAFLCPSDTQKGHIGNQMLDTTNSLLYATTNYKGCLGSNWIQAFAGFAITSSVGRNAGNLDGLDHSNGVFCRGGGTGTDERPDHDG